VTLVSTQVDLLEARVVTYASRHTESQIQIARIFRIRPQIEIFPENWPEVY